MMSFGGGILTTTDSLKFKFYFTTNFYWNMYKIFYLDIGFDVAGNPYKNNAYQGSDTFAFLSLIPTIKIKVYTNKIYSFIGAGLYFKSYYEMGAIFKTEINYNLSKIFSTGTEVKLVQPLGGSDPLKPYYCFGLIGTIIF
jgi:hypothetical protein